MLKIAAATALLLGLAQAQAAGYGAHLKEFHYP